MRGLRFLVVSSQDELPDPVISPLLTLELVIR
jgi:hypothetical protein